MMQGMDARVLAADISPKAISQVDSRVVTGDDERKRLAEMLSQDARRRVAANDT